MALACLLSAAGAAGALAGQRPANVAVFPVENLSGGSVPADETRQFVMDTLAGAGVRVLSVADLDAFMTRHRVRYAAGIDAATAEALRKEAGVDGALFVSVELSSEAVPPKVALIARLVSLEGTPLVVWADDAGMAGDDAPGLFERGLVNDYQALLGKALGRLARSLLGYLQGGEAETRVKAASKFRPRTAYRVLTLEEGRPYTVAVVPFVNISERRNAGELLAALFTRHLSALEPFRVVDAGVTRQRLLDARVIMDGGISLSDAGTVAALLDADFVLGGRVIRYQDYEGPAGLARVEFSTVVIERQSRKVVWSSDSYNEGTDGVHFFERGTTRTAHAMATQMVGIAAGMIAGRDR